MSHPSPLPPLTHHPTTWTPSSYLVLRFIPLLHPTLLLLQVPQRLSPCHVRSRCPSLCHTRHQRPRSCHVRPRHPRDTDVHVCVTRGSDSLAHATGGPSAHTRASHGLGFTLRQAPPPLVYQRRHPAPVSSRRSTTPSPLLVTPAAPTRWSPIVLPRSPSLWIVYSSPPLPLP
jgi:hypothetical protein